MKSGRGNDGREINVLPFRFNFWGISDGSCSSGPSPVGGLYQAKAGQYGFNGVDFPGMGIFYLALPL